MKYIRKNSVFNIGFHLVFTSKYRKPYLQWFEKQISSCFRYCSCKYGFVIQEVDIMPDHIHLFIKLNNTSTSISKIVQRIKGYTSYMIRTKNPTLKKYKAFWSPSYFAESIGNMSEHVIRKYIKNQKINVKSNYKYAHMIKSNQKPYRDQTYNIYKTKVSNLKKYSHVQSKDITKSSTNYGEKGDKYPMSKKQTSDRKTLNTF